MTIEEKARRYDKAKYIMKEYLESGNAGVIAENTIKKAFPELKKSEDKRIRKELTEFLKNASGGFLDTTIQCETFGKWLVWLGKQAGQKPIDDLTQQEAMDIAVAKCFEQGK